MLIYDQQSFLYQALAQFIEAGIKLNLAEIVVGGGIQNRTQKSLEHHWLKVKVEVKAFMDNLSGGSKAIAEGFTAPKAAKITKTRGRKARESEDKGNPPTKRRRPAADKKLLKAESPNIKEEAHDQKPESGMEGYSHIDGSFETVTFSNNESFTFSDTV